MTFTRLKTVVFSHLLLFCIIIAGVSVLPSAAREGIAPERNISVVGGDLGVPEWKLLWDRAREHVRAEKYLQAASVYAEFFKQKPNIEQANWEYCKVLLITGDFKTSTKIIASLLEKNPHRNEYLLAGGQAASQAKDWDAAARYYGRVFEKDPTGELSDVAIEGLVASLRSMGRRELALPLAESLIARQPENLKLIQEIALDANYIGQNEKARQLFKKLLERQYVDDRVLFQAAKMFDIPGKEKQSSVLFEHYLKRHPDYLPFRHKLIEYNLTKGQYDAALEHLVYLVDHLEDNDSVLLQAGTINLYQLGRPDKALIYYEKYLQKHPYNKEIKQTITSIQYILANDFLTIVENDGAWLLWRDLAKVTPNRVAIYLQMADLLDAKGMTKEHLEILSIILHHHPHDETISMRLAQKYADLKQYENALDALQRVGQKRRTKPYYKLKASVEIAMGQEVEALSSYEAALQIDYSDFEIRKTSIELAGFLGNAGKIKALFEGGMKNRKRQPEIELVFTYLDQLSRNHLFREYEQISNRFKSDYNDQNIRDKFDLHLAGALRREGKTRKAEQLLRQLLNAKRSINEVLFVLADNALFDKNLSAAKVWHSVLEKNNPLGKVENAYDKDSYRLLLLKVRIAKATEEYMAAEDLITRFLTGAPKNLPAKDFIPLLADIEKERCWLSFYLGDYKTALRRLEKYSDTGVFAPEIFTLRSLVGRKLKQHTNENFKSENLNSFYLSTGQKLALIETDLEYQEYDAAERQLQTVLQYYPESVVGRVMWAKLLFARGKFSDAAVPLRQLNSLFPEEPYFHKRLIEIEVRRGSYSKGLVLLEQKNSVIKDVDPTLSVLSSSNDMEELLTLARLLWGEKQHEKALHIYRKMLSPTILELLSEKFRQKQINYLYLTKKKTVWNSMLILLQSEPDIIAELMEPSFLVDNLNNEAGKIVVDHYELYSWQKMITTEYLARKAIFEKNYTFAEQSNKRLVDEQGSPEGMIDLAAIYGRIGKYRKEAQVYEAIQSTGTTSPELQKSMERSTLQLSPQSIFDAAYSAKDGRDGFIDMKKVSLGTSFWFTPDLDNDIRLAYLNNQYQSMSTAASTSSNLLYGTAIYEFAKNYELVLGGGVEKMEGSDNAQFLHKINLKGQLDEYFHTYIEWGKSMVDDTVMALNDGINKQELETGLFCETSLGLTFGGDFRHRSYSDNNTQNRIHGYFLYGVFGETVHLSLRYDYQFLTNAMTNQSETQRFDREPQDVSSYWSPPSFTESLLTLHFQQDFLGYQQGSKRKISYYSFDNALGYEDHETLSYTGKFDILLEMDPHFLLKGNFTFEKSDVYEEKSFFLSLHYRW